MQQYIKQILNIGVTNVLSREEIHKIRIINGFNLITSFLILIAMLILLYTGLYQVVYIHIFILTCVSLPLFLLVHYHHYYFAKNYFVANNIFIISLTALKAYQENRFTETENILLGTGISIIILFEKKTKLFWFTCLVICISGLKALKLYYSQGFIDVQLVYILINISVTLITIYGFTTYFKKELEKRKEDLLSLNEEINLQNEQLANDSKILEAQKEVLTNQKIILRGIIDNLPLFIAMLDKEGNYLIANKQYELFFGIPVHQIEGRHYSQILPPEILTTQQPLIDKGLHGRASDFLDYVKERNSYFYGKYTPVKDEKGNLEFLTVFVTDITALKETENKLQEMNKTKDKLFSIIAHDLRSPLNTLSSMLIAAGEGLLTEKEIKLFLANLSKDVANTSRLVDNLLYWAKGQIQKETLNPESFDIQEIIEGNITLFSRKATEKSIHLTSEMEHFLPVWADKNMIDLVLRNLISNALKFTPIHGQVMVILMEKGNFAQICVKDTGMGISADNVGRLFSKEMFTTLGTQKEKGTGLGLMLCKEFIEKNGGQIWVQSTEGEGSIFEFTVPLAN